MAKKPSKADLIKLYDQEISLLEIKKDTHIRRLNFLISIYNDTEKYEAIECDIYDAYHFATILAKRDMKFYIYGRKDRKLAKIYQSSIARVDQSYRELNQETGSLEPDMNLEEACQDYYHACYSKEARESEDMREYTRHITRSFRQYLQVYIKRMEQLIEDYEVAMRSSLKEVYGEYIFDS